MQFFPSLYAGGVRRTECASLSLVDVEDRGEELAVSVYGKRNKPRKVFLDNGAASWLRAYIRDPRASPLVRSSGRRCEGASSRALVSLTRRSTAL